MSAGEIAIITIFSVVALAVIISFIRMVMSDKHEDL